jgi:hypothetical protein
VAGDEQQPDGVEPVVLNPINIGEGGGIWRNIADEGHPSEPMLNPDGRSRGRAHTVGDYYYGKNGSDLSRNLLRNTTGLTAKFFDSKFRVNGDFTFQNTADDEQRRRVEIPYSRSPGVIEYLGTATNDLRNLNDKSLYLASNLYVDYSTPFRRQAIREPGARHQLRAVHLRPAGRHAQRLIFRTRRTSTSPWPVDHHRREP